MLRWTCVPPCSSKADKAMLSSWPEDTHAIQFVGQSVRWVSKQDVQYSGIDQARQLLSLLTNEDDKSKLETESGVSSMHALYRRVLGQVHFASVKEATRRVATSRAVRLPQQSRLTQR